MFLYIIILLLLAALLPLLFYIRFLSKQIRAERILTYFATSLYGRNTINDVFWDLATNCISQLKFEDCVIYYFDRERNVLVQKAAFGPKNPQKHEILNPIEIPLGEGIVGSVAITKKAEIVHDTSNDPRYIVDDEQRLSEITVPIIIDDELFGIIDSEHHSKHYYTQWHLKILESMAGICATKISKYIAEEKLRLKIARDLHDEMGSSLTNINIVSTIAMDQVNVDDPLHQQLSKIKENTSLMMDSMRDIVWAINSVNDRFELMLVRMKEFAAELLEPAGIHYSFKEEGDFMALSLNSERRKDIYLIFKESLNNAVKYSQATTIEIAVKRKDNFLHLLIADNGKGFETSGSYSGNGLKNIQNRAKNMSAEYSITSNAQSGTSVWLSIPVTSLG